MLCEYFLSTLAGSGADRLEVVLMPADTEMHTGHMIRVVNSANPEWYRLFCRQFTARRGLYTARCDSCGGWHRRKGRCLSRVRVRPDLRLHRSKHHDTSIKRRETVRALERIVDGHEKNTPYELRLKEFIRREGRNYLPKDV